jgi:alpha-D-xyloside xylohydrolase
MFPAHATFPSGHDGEQVRQVYGLALQRLTAELFRRRDRRTYGLVRASNAGASNLPYVLYSDLYDHRQFVRALCTAGFSGLLWCPEVRTATTAEEWVRRFQVACFSPLMMLNAWESSQVPWSFPEVEPIVRHYMELRMKLMPYFYAAFARYYFDGTPPFRAMALEEATHPSPVPISGVGAPELTAAPYGEGASPHGVGKIDDQYMAGDSLLVAPLFGGQASRLVYLPPGVWYAFGTAARHEGGRSITVTPGLETIPVFVREGAILPLMEARSHAPAPGEAVAIEAQHYGRLPGAFRLFDDDGETFAFERGGYRWRTLSVTLSPEGEPAGAISAADSSWPTAYGPVTWRFFR